MKILVICQYYYPEPFRISDICEALVNRGHEVTVVTGVPNYPEGVIYNGYENGKRRQENVNGVKVYRCHTIPRKTGTIRRFLNYYSYSISSTRFIDKLTDDFDVILINQLSPVMMASAGIRYAKRHRKPCVLYCLDLWPQSLVTGGIRKNSLVYKYYSRVSANIYNAVDHILTTSNSFSDYFEKEFGISQDKISCLPQYAESIFDDIPPKPSSEVYELVFAGNIGTAQSVVTIVKAANILKDEPVRFHIVGSGVKLDDLQKYADENSVKNVNFHGRRPLSEMMDFYAMADAMLLTLEADPVLSMTLPGKLQSYMAAGKPIIAAIDGEAQRVIEEAECGFCGPAEDENALADNIRRFIRCEDKSSLSSKSRAYYEQHFNKNRFIIRLEDALKERIETK